MALMLCMTSAVGHAYEVTSTFRQQAGTVVLPNLIVGEKVYYAHLELTDAATLSFALDFDSLVNITRPSAAGVTINESADAIVGTWAIPADGGVESLYLKFNADGTYEHFETANDEGCTEGTETGRYNWEPSTGILMAFTLVDNNGECGISNTAPFLNLPLRMFIEEDAMQVLDPDQEYDPSLEAFVFTKVAG